MAVWLLLSGIYTPLIIGFGVASCLLSALIAYRMDVVDHEGHPLHLGPRIITYWGWLFIEIFKANLPAQIFTAQHIHRNRQPEI